MRRTPLAELLQNELERQDFHPRLPGYKRVYEAIRSAIVNRRRLRRQQAAQLP